VVRLEEECQYLYFCTSKTSKGSNKNLQVRLEDTLEKKTAEFFKQVSGDLVYWLYWYKSTCFY
jgi:hypothetical protein